MFKGLAKAAAAGVVGSLLLASAAIAQTISIGYSTDGGATITSFASSNINLANIGGFETLRADGTGIGSGPLGGSLFSNNLDVNNIGTGAAAVRVYVNSQNNTNTSLTAVLFNSAFSFNNTNFGGSTITVTQETYYSLTNDAFAGSQALYTGTMLRSVTFAGGQFVTNFDDLLPAPAGVFSVSTVYTVSMTGGGQANSTINLTATAVPAPVAGAGLVSLLGFAGVWYARRRRSVAA